MKVYILSEVKDPYGLLIAVVRALKWLPIKPKIFLLDTVSEKIIKKKVDSEL